MNQKLLHIAEKEKDVRLWTKPFLTALGEVGELTILENGETMSDEDKANAIRKCDILLTGWGATSCPDCIAENSGNLKYICNITGELAKFLPLSFIEKGILVSNWGEYPARRVAEGAMTLLLAVLKDLHAQTNYIKQNGWKMDMHYHGGSLDGATVGLYGLGMIGKRFLEIIRPFDPILKVYDPYMKEEPEGCERVHSLEELFQGSQIIVIHAALTEETKKSVTAELLATLPRHGVLINTARGGIVDQDALFAELESGRLRAGLDVLEPDSLPDDHPARYWENLILTAHRVDHGWPDFNEPPTELNQMQQICITNLENYLGGREINFRFDRERYIRST